MAPDLSVVSPLGSGQKQVELGFSISDFSSFGVSARKKNSGHNREFRTKQALLAVVF